MNKKIPTIAALVASVGCAYTPIASVGVRGPLGASQPPASATVGGGYRASNGNLDVEVSAEYDNTEDVQGPLTIAADNLTTRVTVARRFGNVAVEGIFFHRTESPEMQTPTGTSDLPTQNIGGLGVGVRAQAGPVDFRARLESILYGAGDDAQATGAWSLSATYRF